MRCELCFYNKEPIGTFEFDVVPRADEMVRFHDGRLFKVAYVEHWVDPKGHTHVQLFVWKFD